MAVLTLQPNEVDTARGLSPRAENSLLKLVVNAILGLSSATTTQVLTQARLTPRAFKALTEEPRPLVQSSITPYEQKVSRTLDWLTAESQSAGFASTYKLKFFLFNINLFGFKEKYLSLFSLRTTHFRWRYENGVMTAVNTA